MQQDQSIYAVMMKWLQVAAAAAAELCDGIR